MKINNVSQNQYKKNSTPNFKMILDKDATKGLSVVEKMMLSDLVAHIQPQEQRLSVKVFEPREKDSAWIPIEIQINKAVFEKQIDKAIYSLQAIADAIEISYETYRQDAWRILDSLGIPKPNTTPKNTSK